MTTRTKIWETKSSHMEKTIPGKLATTRTEDGHK